jgi:tetratricopeptide (TPR) repeat protein
MALLDRDKIWYTAWALVPLAAAVNAVIGYGYESAHRYEWQASAEARMENWAKAAELYARAAEAEPSVVRFAYNAGAAYRVVGDLERARHWNEAALRVDPSFQLALQQRRLLREAARAPAGAGEGRPAVRWQPQGARRDDPTEEGERNR